METTAIIPWVVMVYGALVLAGGLMGWVKAKSRPSLFSGLAFGVLLMLCGVAIWQGRRVGLLTATGLALGLLGVMGMRFLNTRKFMPAGLTALLSLGVLVLLLMTLTG